MKVLFLDIDGVLNRCGYSKEPLEQDKLDYLKQIVYQTGACIVVSSTWRVSEKLMYKLTIQLNNMGLYIYGSTPVDHGKTETGVFVGASRGNEITMWLDEHGKSVDNFCIIDDNSDIEPHWDNFVQTDSFVGLTSAAVSEAIRILER